MSRPTPQTSRPFNRPTFPPLHSSTGSTSSSYQSRSSVSTLASPSPSSSSSAPLPSPSIAQQRTDGFFGSLNQQQQQTQQNQFQFQQQQQTQFPPQNQTSQAPPASNYFPDRQGAGTTAAETNNFLNEYALLAEAAKRAQMACLMRDMEGVEL